MKILRITMMWALLMAAAQMTAKNQFIYADPVTIEAGGEEEIVMYMDFDTDEKVDCWHFSIRLPEGIFIGTKDTTRRPFTMSEGMYDENMGSVAGSTKCEDGSIRVSWYGFGDHWTRTPMVSTKGEFLRISVRSKADKPMKIALEPFAVEIYNDRDEPLVLDSKLLPRDNTLYVEDKEVFIGTETTLSVKMRNAVDAEGFAFDLSLPVGMAVVRDADGMPMVSLSDERTTAARTNTFSAVLRGSTLRVIAASSVGAAISAGDGEVCKVRVRINEHIKENDPLFWGDNQCLIEMKNISVSDTNAQSYDIPLMYTVITYSDPYIGDANGDGNVTVADLTAIAHHVLGNTPEGFAEKAADANEDGQVNVADFTAVAHLLLYGNIEGPAASRQADIIASTSVEGASAYDNTIYIDPVKASVGDELELSVCMKNSVEAEGFQFTLRLPDGVSLVCDADGTPLAALSTARTTAVRTNTFASKQHADGSLTVMAASTNGSAISGGDGEVCTVRVRVDGTTAPGNYELLLSDICISDTHARSYDVGQMVATLTVSKPTAIAEIENGRLKNENYVYDLQGRRMESSIFRSASPLGSSKNSKSSIKKNGVYISDGKKYVR